jgi:hypothetical protein
MFRLLPPAARFVTFVCFVVVVLTTGASSGQMKADDQNTLSAAEKHARWKLLFDGATLDGWRGFKSTQPPAGWKVVDGTIYRAGPGGDLMSVDTYGDFELRLQWKLAEGGNSGIFFHAVPEGEEIWHSAPEMQILDNARHKDGAVPETSAGSNYALHAPARDVTKPIGEWNDVRLVVKGPHVEHWLNGVKLLVYQLWSPDWEARVKKSKFGKIPLYGRAKTGHIGLQDHGDPVWFRNIKIRPL